MEIGEYEVGERLGGGGFGDVFAATHKVIGGEVAVKILHAHRCADPIAVARFESEARAVNKIRHRGIVDIFDFGALPDGRRYFVMERLRGESLRSILDRRSRLPLEEALPILRAIAEAVDAAHAAGVVHRDLKPENVFVDETRAIKLIDFGIAKLPSDTSMTTTETVLGTPAYMSPEQCRGGSVGVESDLYSFGALAYHVLTGVPPFQGSPLALALHHLDDMPRRPSRRAPISRAVDEPILSLLAKDPAQRPRPLVEVVAALAAKPTFRWARVAIAAGVIGAAAGAYAMTRPVPTAPLPPPKTIAATGVAMRRLALAEEVSGSFWMSPDGSYVTYGATKQFLALGRSDPLPDKLRAPYVSFDDHGRALAGAAYTAFAAVGELSAVRGAWPEPCGDQVAIVDKGRLAILDQRTNARRELEPAQGVMGVRWSPSCTRLVWANAASELRVTEVATGETQTLAVTAALRGRVASPAAFIGDDAIAYCTPEANHVALALHPLDARTPDVALGAIPAEGDSCAIGASRDGRTVDVITDVQSLTAGVFAMGETGPSFQLQWDEIVDVFLDETTVIASRHGHRDALDPLVSKGIERTAQVVRLSGARSEVRICPGESAIVMRDGAPVHVALDGDVLSMLEHETCQPIDRWTLPTADARWTRPSCVGASCAIGGIAGDTFHVVMLDATAAREVTHYPVTAAANGLRPAAEVALSPDGTRIVALLAGTARIELITVAGGAHTTIASGDSAAFESPAWADADHFYAEVDNLDGFTGIVRFATDGAHTAWSQASSPGAITALSPSRQHFAVRSVHHRHDQTVVSLPSLQ